MSGSLRGIEALVNSAAHDSLQYFVAYSLPLLAYALVARRQSHRSRGTWLVVLCGVFGYLLYDNPVYRYDLAKAVLAFGYYLAASTAIFGLGVATVRRRVTPDILFVLLFFVLVAIPALLFRYLDIVPLLVIGWLMLLSSYSCCVDAAKNEHAVRFSEFVFFLFVDPTLIFSERARKEHPAAFSWRRVLQVISGISFMVLGGVGIAAFPSVIESLSFGRSLFAKYGAALAWAGVGFIGIYWFRSGLITTKIGILRLLGYSVNDCYVRPYLATSPLDFWRRWNLYVGRWARRYVFSPLALRLARAHRGRNGSIVVPKALALIVTFACIGALHDLFEFAGQAATRFRYVLMFLAAAIALLAWEALIVLYRRAVRPRIKVPPTVIAVLGRIYVAHYIVLMVLLLDGI